MDDKQRKQVREMLHDVLGVYQARNESAIDVTNSELKHINDHLEDLNNSVAKHEKIINENLPHTVAHCPQENVIEKLKENMISGKAIRNAVIIGIGSVGVLFGVMVFIFKIVTKTP
jgi:hypothetical protein